MSKTSGLGMLAAIAVGAALALSSHAGEVKAPSEAPEATPDKSGKGKAGEAKLPSKGPSSASETKPAGKQEAVPMSKGDSKKLANPKTPSGAAESGPVPPEKDKKGRKKRSDKDVK